MEPSDLTALLGGHHFSMPDRIERGMWPHPPLRIGHLIKHLAALLSSRAWFPKAFRRAVPGEMVPDVAVVECRGPSEYIVHLQSSEASGLTVAGYRATAFHSPSSAAEFYLRTGLRLPGDLDGWKVAE
jgi:hypothetical protein